MLRVWTGDGVIDAVDNVGEVFWMLVINVMTFADARWME